MTIRKRIRVPQVTNQSGGGQPPSPAFVAWGPQWGGEDGDEYGIGLVTDLQKLGLIHTSGIGVEHTMPFLALGDHEQGIGINHTMPALGLDGPDQGIGIDQSFAFAFDFEGLNYEIGVAHTMPALALSHDKTIGIDISGSVLGAPFYQTESTYVTSGLNPGASFAITKPSGTVEGDLLVMVLGQGDQAAPYAAPSGWTQIRTDVQGGFRLTSWWKAAGSSEPSSYTFTAPSTQPAVIATMMRVNGADTTSPVDVSGANTASAADPVAPSITTTVANTILIAACVQSNTLNADYTPPAGYTERSDLNGNNSLNVLTITGEVATKPQNATGATGTATMNSTQALGSNYVSHHIAIKPGAITIA